MSLFLPEGLLDFFDIVGHEQKPIKNPSYFNGLTIFLEARPQIPKAYKDHTYKGSGFMEPKVIEDYPIGVNLVSLSLKRRRWDVLLDGKWVKKSRDWNDFIGQGT